MDIVERLQKAIYHDNHGNLPADAAAEIERLRASLEQIAENDPRLGVDILRRIARAALRGEGVE